MPKLYIHIGTQKTGSTAIQYAIRQNWASLKKEGIVYINIPPEFDDLMNGTTVNPHLISKTREWLLHTINRNQNESLRFLISCEGLSGNSGLGYKNANIVAKSLEKITHDLFYNVKIIVYLRNQDEFIESLYTQSIHHGASHSFEEFIQRFDSSSFNWEFLLRAYADVFEKPNIIVRRYHRKYLPDNSSIVQDFGKIINSKLLENYIVEKTPNAGYSRTALEIARLTNPHLNSREKILLRRILQQTNSKQPFSKYSFFTKEEREFFISQYSESNSTVAMEYFNDNSLDLFPASNFDDKIELAYQGLTSEDVAIVMAKTLLFKQAKESIILNSITLIEDSFINWLIKHPNLKDVLKYVANKIGLLRVLAEKNY